MTAPTTTVNPAAGPAWLAAALSLAAVAVMMGLVYGACSQDDAFISFRYAQNLVNGHGLVFNPGEWVEGYTNLSWTLLMAAVLAVGIDPVAGSTALGLLCLAGGVVITADLARRVDGRTGVAAVAAAALVAIDPWTALEAVEGLETALYLALLTGASSLAVVEADDERPPIWSSAVFGVAVLTRPEAPLVAALVHLGLLLAARDRRAQFRRAAKAGVAVAVTLGALTAWRMAYYGDPLPNTFYAKTGGIAINRGLLYVATHVMGHPALWLLLLARPLLRRFDRRDLPLLLPALGILAYVVAVGGDFKPTGRFILPIQGLLAVVAARGLTNAKTTPRRALMAAAGLVLVVGALNAGRGATQWAEIRHGNLEARRTVGHFLAANVPSDTLIAIHSAGAVPYYAGLPTIDMWGLADRHIAHTAPGDFGAGLAGHEKSDPAYVFSRDPAIYLPEDRMFSRRPVQQPVEPGYPADFEDRYRSISIPIEGRFLNVWVRKGFVRSLSGSAPETGPVAAPAGAEPG